MNEDYDKKKKSSLHLSQEEMFRFVKYCKVNYFFHNIRPSSTLARRDKLKWARDAIYWIIKALGDVLPDKRLKQKHITYLTGVPKSDVSQIIIDLRSRFRKLDGVAISNVKGEGYKVATNPKEVVMEINKSFKRAEGYIKSTLRNLRLPYPFKELEHTDPESYKIFLAADIAAKEMIHITNLFDQKVTEYGVADRFDEEGRYTLRENPMNAKAETEIAVPDFIRNPDIIFENNHARP